MIDPERLAALLDGRLPGAERAKLLEQLADSDPARAIYADAAAALRELEHAPRRRLTLRWLAIAAVLAALVLAPALWLRLGLGTRSDPGRFVALLGAPAAGLAPGWEASPWSAVRGAEAPLTPTARAARLGARLTDLDLAVRGHDPSVADRAADVRALLEDIPAAGMVSAMYQDIGTKAGEAPDLAPTLAQAGRAAATLAGKDLVDLGAWLQAARLAASREDTAFFRARESRALLERASGLPGLTEPARATLAHLRSQLAGPPVPAWGALGRDLTELLGILGSPAPETTPR